MRSIVPLTGWSISNQSLLPVYWSRFRFIDRVIDLSASLTIWIDRFWIFGGLYHCCFGRMISIGRHHLCALLFAGSTIWPSPFITSIGHTGTFGILKQLWRGLVPIFHLHQQTMNFPFRSLSCKIFICSLFYLNSDYIAVTYIDWCQTGNMRYISALFHF